MAVYFPKASKPTFYWVFACARLADVAVRGVELQQRRSSDRFGGSFFETQGVRRIRRPNCEMAVY